MMKMLAKNGKIFAYLIFVIIIILNLLGCSKAKNNNKFSLEINKNDKEIFFGTYYQNNDKEKENIKWLILEKDEKSKKALLLSKYLIDYHEFSSNKGSELIWEKSDIKKYLENDFFNNAFTEEDKKYISDDENGKIFLLSIDEVEKYELSVCHPTNYASEKEKNNVYSNIHRWWLRSSGAGKNNLAFVDEFGKINYVGDTQNAKDIYFRPAIWVYYHEDEIDKKTINNINSNDTRKNKEAINNNALAIGNIGDIVKLGQFETDIQNVKSDIEWIIINKDEENNKAFLLSRFGIDCQKYSNFQLKIDDKGNVIEPTLDDAATWETSLIRKWLNEDFYNNVFDDVEKKYILDTEVKTEDNTEYGVDGGNDTIDKLFLLSIEEIKENINNINWLKCIPTKLTREKIEKTNKYKKDGIGIWWLRSPGPRYTSNRIVGINGDTSLAGQYEENLVRPAMWINYVDKESVKLSNNVKPLRLGDEGSFVGFGEYQSNNYDPYITDKKIDKIIWKVQHKDPINNKALLVTEEIIDSIPYRKTSEAATWETSYVRAWLNQHFYENAFTDIEKEKIIKTKLDNTNRATMGKSGADTEDNIFLLSYDDILLYFEDGEMSADVTNYGLSKGLTSKEINRREKKYRGTYLLRNMDGTNHIPYAVFPEEYFDCRSDRYVAYEDGIRPAVWVYYEDTDKDLSYLYQPWGFKTLILNLFYGDSNIDEMPLTDNFLKKHKNDLLEEFKINYDKNDDGYIECNVNEDEKTFTIDVKVYGFEDYAASQTAITRQTATFEYIVDDNYFLDDIILKKNVINGEEPGINIDKKGPGSEIEAKEKEAEKEKEKETKNISNAFIPLPDVKIESEKIGIEKADSLGVGNEIVFGKYIRSTDLEDIKWTIYEKDESEGKVFLISNQVLDSKEYDTSGLFLPEWDTCTLRIWLNTDFYNTAFNAEEKGKIIETRVETYEQFREEPTITNDKVFVLSESEVKKYFPTKESKRCWATPYSHAKGKDSVYWWIRNHSVSNKGKYVSETGVIYADRIDNPERVGIRPALWVKYK